MSLHEFARAVIIPLFMLNMAAIAMTLFIKKRIRPEFSQKLDITFIVENIIGIICVLAMAYISFFARGR